MAAVMASGGYCSRLPIYPRMDSPRPSSSNACYDLVSQRSTRALKSNTSETFGQRIVDNEVKKVIVDGSRMTSRSNPGRLIVHRKSSPIRASWLPSCQIASSAFTFGTVAVLPFYASMIVAPGTEFTKKLMSSAITYVILGVAYSYLLYRSWTPDTIGLLFASKYWLPELSGMARMFSSNMTLASAWIHLLVVDLFAARQIYFDGLRDNIETRHSVLLCLMCCPVGILCHFITRAITRIIREGNHGITNKDLLDVKMRKPADEKDPMESAFLRIEVIVHLLKEIGRAVITILATSIL